MIGVNGRRRIKPAKGILDFFKKINDAKGIVNGFTILLVLSITMKNYVASSKKTLNRIANSSRLECKNHTQFETKMTKIDILFLTKMSLKNHTL